MNGSSLDRRLRSKIFGAESNFEARFIRNFKEITRVVEHCKGLGLSVVLTQGTYDMLHIGHARYFEAAKKHGDLLIVGVDSDAKVRARKGPDRPVVPQEERLEMVTHVRAVDIVTLKDKDAVKWSLIKAVRPDILIATRETYDNKQLKELKQWCGKVVVLDPMAVTSTSAKIRRLQLNMAKRFRSALAPKILDAIEEFVRNSSDKGKGKK